MSLYLVMRLRVTLRFVAVSSTIMIRNFRSCEADIISNAKKVKKTSHLQTSSAIYMCHHCIPSRIE